MSDLQDIARTVTALAEPGMKPKALVTAVRKHHPEASKKEICRAAFMATILAADTHPGRADELHTLALGSRGEGAEADADVPSRSSRKG